MAGRRFSVHHFIACQGVQVVRAGPINPYNLQDVQYTFEVAADAEWPARLDGLWVFARFFDVRRVSEVVLRVVWLDDPLGPTEVCTFPPWVLRPRAGEVAADRSWRIDAVRFPGEGRYLLELSTGRRRPRLLSREFFQIARRSP